ncbi:hypothetical protein [Brevibacillus brevis]|uniref:hypothetical protein n=1 Tax=Brevibacillus brevis TaxID=1393 RepID=UPI001A930FFB|nr:hypothetical protein [Brevibacillus brevis]
MDIHLFYHLAPKFMKFGLLAKAKVPGVQYDKIQTTKEGFSFLAKLSKEKAEKSEAKEHVVDTVKQPPTKKKGTKKSESIEK